MTALVLLNLGAVAMSEEHVDCNIDLEPPIGIMADWDSRAPVPALVIRSQREASVRLSLRGSARFGRSMNRWRQELGILEPQSSRQVHVDIPSSIWTQEDQHLYTTDLSLDLDLLEDDQLVGTLSFRDAKLVRKGREGDEFIWFTPENAAIRAPMGVFDESERRRLGLQEQETGALWIDDGVVMSGIAAPSTAMVEVLP